MRSEQTGLAGLELVVAIVVHRQDAYTVQLVAALVLQSLAQLVHLVFYPMHGLRVADVVCLNVRLSQQAVVNLQLGVKAQCAQRGQEQTASLVVAGHHMVGHKSAKSGNDDAVILEKKYFYMSSYFNHSAKVVDFSELAKNKEFFFLGFCRIIFH